MHTQLHSLQHGAPSSQHNKTCCNMRASADRHSSRRTGHTPTAAHNAEKRGRSKKIHPAFSRRKVHPKIRNGSKHHKRARRRSASTTQETTDPARLPFLVCKRDAFSGFAWFRTTHAHLRSQTALSTVKDQGRWEQRWGCAPQSTPAVSSELLG